MVIRSTVTHGEMILLVVIARVDRRMGLPRGFVRMNHALQLQISARGRTRNRCRYISHQSVNRAAVRQTGIRLKVSGTGRYRAQNGGGGRSRARRRRDTAHQD